jgi:hypothetical protein
LLKKVSYQNSTSRNYVYDNADRVTNITNNLGGNLSESYDYGYDNNSNRQSEVRKENGVARRTASYQYDGLDRLHISQQGEHHFRINLNCDGLIKRYTNFTN